MCTLSLLEISLYASVLSIIDDIVQLRLGISVLRGRTLCSLGGDKVRMLTHTYQHKPVRKIPGRKVNMAVCNHQTDCPQDLCLI